jgi:hypothetical protein
MCAIAKKMRADRRVKIVELQELEARGREMGIIGGIGHGGRRQRFMPKRELCRHFRSSSVFGPNAARLKLCGLRILKIMG